MDLVVGATGLVGQQIALGLRRQGRAVRALVRGGTHHEKAAPLISAGVEIVDADLTKPETLASACAGVDTVLCTATSMPHGKDDGLRRVDHDGVLVLIDNAERSGVRHFIYTSYSGNLRMDSPLETAKRASEKRMLSGKMRVTILRPSYFMEMWLSPALGFDPASGRARIYGLGDAKISYISFQDVVSFALSAALLRRTLRSSSRWAGLNRFPSLRWQGFSKKRWAKSSNWKKCPLPHSRSSIAPPIRCKRRLPH